MLEYDFVSKLTLLVVCFCNVLITGCDCDMRGAVIIEVAAALLTLLLLLFNAVDGTEVTVEECDCVEDELELLVITGAGALVDMAGGGAVVMNEVVFVSILMMKLFLI